MLKQHHRRVEEGAGLVCGGGQCWVSHRYKFLEQHVSFFFFFFVLYHENVSRNIYTPESRLQPNYFQQ